MVVLVFTYYHTWCVLSVFIGMGKSLFSTCPYRLFFMFYCAIGILCINHLKACIQKPLQSIGIGVGIGGLYLRYTLSVYGIGPI